MRASKLRQLANYEAKHGEKYANVLRRRHLEAFQERERGYAYTDSKRARDLKRRALKNGVDSERIDPGVIFERDGFLRQLCKTVIDRTIPWPNAKSASIDHVIPLSQGGAHKAANLQSAHLGCNIAKGNRLRDAQLRLVG